MYNYTYTFFDFIFIVLVSYLKAKITSIIFHNYYALQKSIKLSTLFLNSLLAVLFNKVGQSLQNVANFLLNLKVKSGDNVEIPF